MTCETFNETINEIEYTYTQLPATKSLRLKFKIAKVIGGAINEIIPAMGKDKTKDGQIKAFGKAMQTIFTENNPDHVVDLIISIFIPAFRDGKRINMDNDFTGNMVEMYEVLFWVLRCEYGNFIEGFMEEEE